MMPINPGTRKSASLKAYSRRANNHIEEPPSKKRRVTEVSIVKSPPPVKNHKRSSIESYFKSLPRSSSPALSFSLHASSNSLEPTSTPPSSPPPKAGSSLDYPRKLQQRPRRRLTTRPPLAPITNRSTKKMPIYDDDDDRRSFAEVVGSLEDDSRVSYAEEYLDQEERRELDLSQSPQFNPTPLLAGSNNPLQAAMAADSPSKAKNSNRKSLATVDDHHNAIAPGTGNNSVESFENNAKKNARENPFATKESTQEDNESDDYVYELPTATKPPKKLRTYHTRGTSSAPCWTLDAGNPDEAEADKDPPSLQADIVYPPKKAKKGTGLQQALIDMSIERFVDCKDCGMHYNQTIREDRKLHNTFHHNVMRGSQPKKNTPTVDLMDKYIDGDQHRVRVLDRRASVEWRRHFEAALEVTYAELPGLKLDPSVLWSEIKNPLNKNDPNKVPKCKIYVYLIGVDPVAVLLAERIARGGAYYRGPITNDEYGPWPNIVTPPEDEEQEYVSKDISYECYMSVDRIWTHRDHRHKGYATMLVDYAREDFITGLVLSKKRIAFSLPTTMGRGFAEKYCKGVFDDADFLVNLEDAQTVVEDGKLRHFAAEETLNDEDSEGSEDFE